MSLKFTVRRKAPELLRPAAETPYEFKPLSDIDDQQGLRFHIPFFYVYRHDDLAPMAPVDAIRNGIAGALVHYYPLAGRLREEANNKLVVECTGEGISFVEAEADVKLEELKDWLQPQCPCSDELLPNVEGFDLIGAEGPLLSVQVTRFQCGGFVFAVSNNHTICDGVGMVQFLTAVAEIARGATQPSVLPVWRRELLRARDPPCISRSHRAYDHVPDDVMPVVLDLVTRSFFFGPKQVATLAKQLSPEIYSTKFELISACVWKCRTISMRICPDDDVRFIFPVETRAKCNLPAGYYGNALAFATAVTTAGKLFGSPLNHAVELIRKERSLVDAEYVQSQADFLVLHGKRNVTIKGSFIASNLMRVGVESIDVGWGPPIYSGPPTAYWLATSHVPAKSKDGIMGTMIALALPADEMDLFVLELEKMTKESTPETGTD